MDSSAGSHAPARGWDRLPRAVVLAILVICPAARAQAGQLGALVSPGPLAKAHASLEGADKCWQCHEAGRKVTASRCLSCHKPIAERIARKAGVHRAVTDDCVRCHVEHAGAEAELRRFDTRTFNHAVETGFPRDGLHARATATCAACHKRRSFLEANPACSTCHADMHKGTLGTDCTRCHSTSVGFKESRKLFDHTHARFALTGAHRTVACEKCHTAGTFRGLEFETCSSCHKSPHRKALGPSCTSCHTTEQWETKTVDHARTAFPLVGAHAQVACAKCHQARVTAPLAFDRCAACHANVHRDSIKEDCRVCHTNVTFRGATFDHGARTSFPLVGKHAALACRQCHTTISAADVPLAQKVVDFGGAARACVACHRDPHKGDFGLACDACHRPATFSVAGFAHPRAPEFFAGQHAGLACARCHAPSARPQPTRTGLPMIAPRPAQPILACAACHADVHLGQVGSTCELCHGVDAARFAAARFSHDRAAFPLTGKHRAVECAKCHPRETRAFPGGSGTAMNLKPRPTDCQACHQDPHMGQLSPKCDTCHVTETFRLFTYTHRGLERFFSGFHGRLPCASCHKKEAGRFPAGAGTAVRYKVGTACKDCHPQF